GARTVKTEEPEGPTTHPNGMGEEVASIQHSLLRLRSGAGAIPGRDSELLEEAIEELSVTVEEMRATDEELREQNLELAAATEEAARQGHRYRELFDFAPDGYVVTDLDGIIRQANRAAAQMLGLGERFLIGKPLAAFVAGEERSSFRRQLNRLRGPDGELDWHLRLRRRGGSEVPVAVRIGVMASPDGGLAELQWALRDVSD